MKPEVRSQESHDNKADALKQARVAALEAMNVRKAARNAPRLLTASAAILDKKISARLDFQPSALILLYACS
jgi:hypothetical protein